MDRFSGEASAVDASEKEAWRGDALARFQHLRPADYLFGAVRKAGTRENHGVYTSAVVMWLMIGERLQNGTLASAVLELLGGCRRASGRSHVSAGWRPPSREDGDYAAPPERTTRRGRSCCCRWWNRAVITSLSS